ncbi:hypothetical protein EYF80_062082 [Liparis tanakae]|uniref:Uncharacterized protein n=1 Tax=Liparis tanakae TaxID=230148 RepID=A0A4Z2EGJ6_9TELE|nr:hypothetical protein EYF80_062082 [Liparis tanakae]
MLFGPRISAHIPLSFYFSPSLQVNTGCPRRKSRRPDAPPTGTQVSAETLMHKMDGGAKTGEGGEGGRGGEATDGECAAVTCVDLSI